MSITRVGIIGSGIMGAGIAEVAAANGHDVVLRSRSTDSAEATVTSSVSRTTIDRSSPSMRLVPVMTPPGAGPAPSLH